GTLRGQWLIHERMSIELVREPGWMPPQPVTMTWDDLDNEIADRPIGQNEIPGVYLYRRVGFDERPLELLPTGRIGKGAGQCERTWRLVDTPSGQSLGLFSDNGGDSCWLTLRNDSIWRGHWLNHERMPIELILQNTSA
ncbi:MAG: hypothetical protein JWM11_418, partial [Planctomycetaceae bacterium]|nr:hypothetical protein [Planctomycetaceae bacterium]